MVQISPQFGKYRLIAELGRGGMATVYLALSEASGGLDFNKLVVIKRLREHLAADDEFVTMLKDEARIAARLNHQNVVQTLEVGEHAGELFLAMEFLDGQPLNRMSKRGGKGFTLDLQLTILSDVLAGIQYAHELRDFDGTPFGLVHRDVTPHNVFVTYDGQVKVLDFGIAKAAGRSSETKHGVVKGKLAYMAPEQARGEMLDRRADIFAVGAMLYEACVGQRLWQGLSEAEMLRSLVNGRVPVSPRERQPEVDPDLDAMCRRALAPDPNDRYPTAEDFAVDIEEFMRVKAPRVRARKLGAWLSELFADKRALTTSTIEAQLEEVRARSAKQVIVPLGDRPSITSTSEVDVEVEDDFGRGEDNEDSGAATRVVNTEPTTTGSISTSSIIEVTARSPGAAAVSQAAVPATSRAMPHRPMRLVALSGIALLALIVIGVALVHASNAPAENPPAPSTQSAPK